MEVNINSIKEALDLLDLPPFITRDDIKEQYKRLAKKYHPDIYDSDDKMSEINLAYSILIEYIENYRYSFDSNEINKQMPNLEHNKKFKP